MSHVAKYALTIVAGGLALGAVLGSAADPEMKRPAAPWWQQSGGRNAPGSATDNAWPAPSVAYPGMADSYRPDLDYDTVVTSYWEPPADWPWYGEGEGDGDADSSSLLDGVTERVADPAAEAAGDAAVEVAGEALDASAGSVSTDPATAAQPPVTEDGLY